MKNIRFAAFLLAVLMLLSALQAGLAASAREEVYDDASVLSGQTVADIVSLNELCEDIDLSFTVVTRHFLGGKEAQAYCDALFDEMDLSDESVLLLLVIGEERYALSAGEDVYETLSADKLANLLAANFRTPYLTARDYNGAVGVFMLSAAKEAARAKGESIDTAGLFGTQKAQSAQAEQSSGEASFTAPQAGEWWSGFFSGDESIIYKNADGTYSSGLNSIAKTQDDKDDNDSGFSFGKLIVILLIISLLSKKKKVKRNPGPRPGSR